MKCKFLLSISFFLITISSCADKDDKTKPDEETKDALIDFKKNLKDSFENEISTSIDYKNTTINYFTTKSNNNEELDAITFLENGETTNIEFNETRDTLLIYKSNDQALRLYMKQGFLNIENLEISDGDKTTRVISKYVDDTPATAKRKNSSTAKTQLDDDGFFDDFIKSAEKWVSDYTLPGKLQVFVDKVDNIKAKLGAKATSLIESIKSFKTKENEVIEEFESVDEPNVKTDVIKDSKIFKYLQKKWWEYRKKDCNLVISGDAYYDECEECVGGNTGKVDCNDNTAQIDLIGTWNLDVTLPSSGICDEVLIMDETNSTLILSFNSNNTFIFLNDPGDLDLNSSTLSQTFDFNAKNKTLKISVIANDGSGGVDAFTADLIFDESKGIFSGNYTNKWSDGTVCKNSVKIFK